MKATREMTVAAWMFSWLVASALAAIPALEPAFSAAQIETGAPVLGWTRNADGSESAVISEKDGGLDLKGVKITRRVSEDDDRAEIAFTLENTTEEMRYASFGWRTHFETSDASATSDRNWIPTADNVLDLTIMSSLWGYYTKPGPWHFSLVEPWFAAYNPGRMTGFAFLFDFSTLSAAYCANDMKTRGVLFDGGMLPPGESFTARTVIRKLNGLGAIATVNDDFAAGFTGPAFCPTLAVRAFRDLTVAGEAMQTDVEGNILGSAKVNLSIRKGETRTTWFRCEKPQTQTVLSAELNGIRFEQFRENGFRMASLPMVPAIWPHHRPIPPKTIGGARRSGVRPPPGNKALLLFGFYANFFRFQEMFPELEFTVIPATPQGIAQVPPASTIGEYRYVFLGDVNEESVRPMLARLASYVENGGTLVVGGGPFAYGCGGYAGTFLESMLPVRTHAFDCLPASADDADGRTAVAFDGCGATLFWIHRDEPKEGSEVVLKTSAGDPLLVKGAYGAGTVYAFLGTPLGDEGRDAKAFWNGNGDYLKTMRGLLK
ncbi:MAG: hypothetical protein ILM98_14445 [Kiritimatiellae bacterium]|nr:hypothetical protein [Kiritimatiellia bacterium]